MKTHLGRAEKTGHTRAFILGILMQCCCGTLDSSAAPPAPPADRVARQIEALQREKAAFTPAQQKMDSQLVFALKRQRGQIVGRGETPQLRIGARTDLAGVIEVDITATVNPDLIGELQNTGAIVNQSARFHSIRAQLPLAQLEKIASRADVNFIRPAAPFDTRNNIDPEGDVVHGANLVRDMFQVDGSGVKVGVISDGVTLIDEAQQAGDLGPVRVLPGQGNIPFGKEGTAMLEIIHALAPGAQLFFATARGGAAHFAENILALRGAGCDIIVDDAIYFDEPAFQDGIIAQAVNEVTSDGALYFSAAGNEGNLDSSSSGTWEGDFVNGGPVGPPVNGRGGFIHNFGGFNYNSISSPSDETFLSWSDPLGASTNDYDLYLLDNAGNNVIGASINVQNGFQDPYERLSLTTAAFERVVIVQASGTARFLRLNVYRGRLAIATSGSIWGHNCASNAFAIAAVGAYNSYPNLFTGGASNPVEYFSSDGFRRIFYQPDGTPLTPGDFSSTGGIVRNKPDLTAADGVTTGVRGLTSFFGTSAAAPHAAAIAALLKSYNETLTPAQMRTLLTNTALDIMAPGFDRSGGAGIVMATTSVQAAPVEPLHITPRTGFTASGPVGGPFFPQQTFSLTNVGTSSLNWNLGQFPSWLSASPTNGTLAPGGPATTVSINFAAAATSLARGVYNSTLVFSNLNDGTAQSREVLLRVEPPNDFFTELFVSNQFDLAFSTLTFTPDDSPNFYTCCRQTAFSFPTDPTGGTVLPLTDDIFFPVVLNAPHTIAIYNTRTNTFFVGANGYITLNAGDTFFIEFFLQHFTLPRVSGLFHDLNPATGGTVSWRQLSDRVAVTFQGVPERGTNTPNDFQMELFDDGRIRLTYLNINCLNALVGLSAGQDIPIGFFPSDLSTNAFCVTGGTNYVGIEAESGAITSPMMIESDPLASQGRFIVSHTSNAGTASYDVNVPSTGQYVMWCRVLSTNFNADSFFVSVDGGAELIYDTAEHIPSPAWQWTRVLGRQSGFPVNLNPRIFDLAAGNHTFMFRGRDPNTQLDRLLLTDNTNFVPIISLEAESGIVQSPMSILADTNASHSQYVVSPVAETGQVTLDVDIAASTDYLVWCRVLATNANADSFYVSVDGGPELIYDVAENIWTNTWQWSRLIGRTNGGPVNLTPRILPLGQSKHTLVFRAREAGTQLDRLLIVNDPDYNPASVLNPLATVSQLESNTLRLQFVGQRGLTYLIQATDNLLPPISWSNVYTNTADWNGTFIFDDGITQPYRFYRLVGQ